MDLSEKCPPSYVNLAEITMLTSPRYYLIMSTAISCRRAGGVRVTLVTLVALVEDASRHEDIRLSDFSDLAADGTNTSISAQLPTYEGIQLTAAFKSSSTCVMIVYERGR